MPKGKKDYVVFYRSLEHYEILGFVRALSQEEAIENAKKSLLEKSKHYGVRNAMLFEITNGVEISFNQEKRFL